MTSMITAKYDSNKNQILDPNNLTSALALSLTNSGGVNALIGPSGRKLTTQNLRNKFFASLPNGANYRTRKSLVAIPAWVTGTLYGVGSVVQNAGNAYFLLGTSGVTLPIYSAAVSYFIGDLVTTGGSVYVATAASLASAPPSANWNLQSNNGISLQAINSNGYGVRSTVAPAGTGTGTISSAADGLSWIYLGAAESALSDQSDTPALSYGTQPAAATRRYDPNNAADVNAYWFTGAAFQFGNTPGGGFNGLVAIQNGGYGNQTGAVAEFVTDSPIVWLQPVANFSTSFTQNALSINGYDVSYKSSGPPIPFTNVVNGNNLGVVLDWTGKANKIRRVRYPMGNQVFSGVYVPPQYSVWAPVNPNRYRLYVEGDSVTQGGQPSNGGITVAQRLAQSLGCDDVWTAATGGTGFINPGASGNLQTRSNFLIAAAPDILYIHPVNNDVGNDGTYNSATRQAAYKKYFDTLLAALPDLIIICSGGYATTAGNLLTTAVSAWQVEADMAAAISTYGHPHVKFIPTISDPNGRWMYGDGHVGTTGNSTHGNSDLMIGDGADTLHPNIRYYEVMVQRVYNQIVNVMNTLTD